jgi:glutamate synthase (NADPH/NADH) small chain
MGEVNGFLKYDRQERRGRPIAERLLDYHDVYEPVTDQVVATQGARCLDCGIPYCHVSCPLGNFIPYWNDLVAAGEWQQALEQLHGENNFPEFTGHVCPALCEGSCTLGLHFAPVAIKMIELQIIEVGFANGWVTPQPPPWLTGKRVAVVGSGPAGLAAAQQLRRMGHAVTVFERDDRVGGLLRYGIPNFKLEKEILDRRLVQLEAEGIVFKTGVHVGVTVTAEELRREFDAVLLAGGAQQPRDLVVEGRDLHGIHYAMEFLTQQNRRCAGDTIDPAQAIDASGKHVVVIGGGDTGADCVGTALRQGARSVTSLELMPRPSLTRPSDNPWPEWPNTLRTSSSHEEGGERIYGVLTRRLVDDEHGHVRALEAVQVNWRKDETGRMQMDEVAGSMFTLPCDLVLLAMGFLGPIKGGMLEQFGVQLNSRGTLVTDQGKMTSVPGIFAAGDMSRGQSLVVWAIAEGRAAAEGINKYLLGRT